jgi:hypothetical protein
MQFSLVEAEMSSTMGEAEWCWKDIASRSWGEVTMNIQAIPSRHWEDRARDALDKAKTLSSTEARRLMREVARRYRLMASIASKGASSKAARARRQ